MAGRLTRWQWALQHTKFGWREIVSAGLVAVIGWGLLGQALRPELRGAASIALGVVLVSVCEFGWRFARARTLQDRVELGTAIAASQAMRAELDVLAARRPAIQTRVETYRADWFVVVHNVGANGSFRAEIRIHSPQDFADADMGASYRGYWEHGSASADILSGFQERLRIGATRTDSRGIQTLVLYFVGLYMGPETLAQDWSAGSRPPNPKPILHLEITISSEPEMREPFVHFYTLDLDAGLVESTAPGP